MSKQVQKEVFELAREALAPFGYRKRIAGIFTREINKETLSWIGLGISDGWGRSPVMDVSPTIGVRNYAIETIFTECVEENWRRGSGGKWKPSSYSPTISRPLRYLVPEGSPRDWEFEEATDHAPLMRGMVAAIESYGHPFMEAHASLSAITEVLMDPEYRYVDWGQAGLRRSIAQ